LYRQSLGSVASVRRLVERYVAAHNTGIPHSTFRGRAPDERYHDRIEDIPEKIEMAEAASPSGPAADEPSDVVDAVLATTTDQHGDPGQQVQ
jgi:hypothetical protein